MSDTDIPWSAQTKLGKVVERSRISKSANHDVAQLSTSLDQESSEGKRGTLGWTKGDCVFEREKGGEYITNMNLQYAHNSALHD